jgi:hypothetical protein
MKQILNSIRLSIVLNLAVFFIIAAIGFFECWLDGSTFEWKNLMWLMLYSILFTMLFAFVNNENVSKWLLRGFLIIIILLFFVIPRSWIFSTHLIYLFFSLLFSTKFEKLFLMIKDITKKKKSDVTPN